MQGLGRGQAASYGAPCTNQAAEFISRRLKEQRKADSEAGAPPVLIPPIPKLDQQRLIKLLISSKVSSILLRSLPQLTLSVGTPADLV